MDVRAQLNKLPEPQPEALDRVWDRYKQSRASTSSERRVPWALFTGAGLVLAAATALVFAMPEGHRTVVLKAEAQQNQHAWSKQIDIQYAGQGEISGTSRNAEIHWRSGTLKTHVVPNSNTKLTVITDEARIEVVGTVFSVTRDSLGVTTEVEKGKVLVTCTDGWKGFLTPQTGSHTCLPTRAGLLLGRADALLDRGADPKQVMATLDKGLQVAERDSAMASELLVRRMHMFGDQGNIDGVLQDADAYLAGPGSRRTEVQRFAGYSALQAGDCVVAIPYLSELELAGTAEDRVLLAECLVDSQPARAGGLLNDALPNLDDAWKARAQGSLDQVKTVRGGN